jgi:hypothetical protein
MGLKDLMATVSKQEHATMASLTQGQDTSPHPTSTQSTNTQAKLDADIEEVVLQAMKKTR